MAILYFKIKYKICLRAVQGGPTNNILTFILFYNMSICFNIKNYNKQKQIAKL